MDGHVTPDLIRRYRGDNLAPEDRLAVSDHLSTCAPCRAELRRAVPRSLRPVSAVAELWAEAGLDEPHLTNEQVASYISPGSIAKERQAIETHLSSCSACAHLVKERRAWRGARAGLPAREYSPSGAPIIAGYRAPLGAQMARANLARLWNDLQNAVRTSLASLAPAAGAYAKGATAAPEIVEFPVAGEEGLLEGVTGMIVRRGNDYYVRIELSETRLKCDFSASVLVVIYDPVTERVILERVVRPERTILFGTNVALTSECYVMAQLSSPEDTQSSGGVQ